MLSKIFIEFLSADFYILAVRGVPVRYDSNLESLVRDCSRVFAIMNESLGLNIVDSNLSISSMFQLL